MGAKGRKQLTNDTPSGVFITDPHARVLRARRDRVVSLQAASEIARLYGPLLTRRKKEANGIQVTNETRGENHE